MSATKFLATDETLQRIALAMELKANMSGTAGFHNSVARMKSLGSAVTSEQWAAISSGTFDDLFVGDYWTINSVKWRIAGFDLFLHTGDTAFGTHHVVIVPDTNLYTAKMNEGNVTTGGYWGSAMKTANLASALEKATTAFGTEHVLTRRSLFCNAVADGSASGWAWQNTQIDIMSERQVYGSGVWGSNNGYNVGECYSRFPLFVLAPEFITNRSWYWLCDVVSASNFAGVSLSGHANSGAASNAAGVRPTFCIG